MMNITELFSSDLGKQIIEGIGQKTETSEKETSSVIISAVPALLGALQNNATSTEGANGILGALTSSKHNGGGVLDNLSDFFTGSDSADGEGILGHIFGDQQKKLEEGISTQSGVSSGKVSQILIILAPILMGYLGKQTQKNNVESSEGLSDMLSNMLGGSVGSSILNKILDQNGDGNLGLDDLKNLFSGDKKYDLGDLFGKILGK